MNSQPNLKEQNQSSDKLINYNVNSTDRTFEFKETAKFGNKQDRTIFGKPEKHI